MHVMCVKVVPEVDLPIGFHMVESDLHMQGPNLKKSNCSPDALVHFEPWGVESAFILATPSD